MKAPSKRKQTPLNIAIQAAKRSFGFDDVTYRNFLEDVTGKRSTTEMNKKELWQVLEAFKENGFKMGRPQGEVEQSQDEQVKLARHLCLKLKNYGVLRDSSEKALLGYVHRITYQDSFEKLAPVQLNKIIETLKKWVAREERKIILAALECGKLQLPIGFVSLKEVENLSLFGQAEKERVESRFEFNEQCATLLDSYMPEVT